MKLTNEYIKKHDLTYNWSRSNGAKEIWKLLKKKVIDYDEGIVTTTFLFQNLETNEFWVAWESSNSWDDYGDFENEEPVQVYPTVVQITRFVDENGEAVIDQG